MQTLAVLSHKGGTGKTTIATHLAMSAQAAGHRTVLVDMDPQRSALAWSRHRSAYGAAINEAPVIQEGPIFQEGRAGTLYFARQAAERLRVELMVADTAPNCEADTLDAARWADLCLIVVRPSFFDIQAVGRTVDVVRSLGRPGLFLLNQAPAGQGRAMQEATAALSQYGLPVSAIRLHARPVFQTAAAAGLTVGETAAAGPAAAEVNALWRDLSFRLGLDQVFEAAPLAATA